MPLSISQQTRSKREILDIIRRYDERRLKISRAHLGKRRSSEERAAISAGVRQWWARRKAAEAAQRESADG